MTRSDEIFSRLSSLQYVEAEVLAGSVFALVREYDWALREVPPDDARYEVLSILAAAFREHAGFLLKHPSAVFQCFWNSCWWHDCLERRAFGLSCQSRGPVSRLMEEWRAERERAGGPSVWLRSLRPPVFPANPALRMRVHVDSIECPVSLNFSGETLMVWCKGHLRGAWNINDGTPVDRALVRGLACPDPRRSKDGTLTVSNHGRANSVCVTDVGSGEEVLTFQADFCDNLSVFAFSENCQTLAAGGWDAECRGIVYVWDLQSRSLVRFNDPRGSIFPVAISPDGTKLLTGSEGHLVLRDLKCDGATQELPEIHAVAAAFSPCGNLAAVAGLFGTIHVFDLSGTTHPEVVPAHHDYITEMRFSPTGSRLVTRTMNGSASLWNGWSGEPITVLEENDNVVLFGGETPCLFVGEQTICSAPACFRTRAVQTTEGATWRWYGWTGTPQTKRDENNKLVMAGQGAETHHLVPGGERISSAPCFGGRWASEDGSPIDLGGDFWRLWSLRFSPDGQHVAGQESGGGESAILFGKLEGKEYWTLEVEAGRVAATAFSPDGAYFILVSTEGCICVWDVERELARYDKVPPPGERETSCAVSSDGLMIAAVGEEGPIRVQGAGIDLALDVREAKELRFFGHDRIAALTGQGSVEIWNYRTGRKLATVEWFGTLQSFSPDAQYSTSIREGEFRVMDARTGTEVASLPCSDFMSCETSVGPEGRWIWAGRSGRDLYHFALEGSRSVI